MGVRLRKDEFYTDQYGIKEYVTITGLINKIYLRGRRSLCFRFISKYGIQVNMYYVNLPKGLWCSFKKYSCAQRPDLNWFLIYIFYHTAKDHVHCSKVNQLQD